MKDDVTIILTTPEAIEFRQFQQNYQIFKDFQKFHATFEAMINSGAFNVNYGKVVLHFAKNELQKVTIEADTWKKLDK